MALVAAVGGGAVALAWQLNAASWVVQLVAFLALVDFTLVAQFFRVPGLFFLRFSGFADFC